MRKIILFVFFGLALPLTFSHTAYANAKIKKELHNRNSAQKERNVLRERIQALNQKIQQNIAHKGKAQKKIKQNSQNLRIKQNKLQELISRRELLEKKLRLLIASRSGLKRQVSEKKRILAKMLLPHWQTELAKQSSIINQLVSHRSAGEIQRHKKYLLTLENKLSLWLNNLQKDIQDVNQNVVNAQQIKRKLKNVHTQIIAQVTALEKDVLKQKNTLKNITQKLNKQQEQIAVWRNNEARLKSLIGLINKRIRKEKLRERRRLANLAKKKKEARQKYQQKIRQQRLEKKRRIRNIKKANYRSIKGGTVTSLLRVKPLWRFNYKNRTGARSKGWLYKTKGFAKVRAIAAGKVISSGFFKGYGNLIIIDHGRSIWSLYAYNQKILVKRGQRLRKGQQIGVTGNIKPMYLRAAKGLYLEIRINQKVVNPARFFK